MGRGDALSNIVSMVPAQSESRYDMMDAKMVPAPQHSGH